MVFREKCSYIVFRENVATVYLKNVALIFHSEFDAAAMCYLIFNKFNLRH